MSHGQIKTWNVIFGRGTIIACFDLLGVPFAFDMGGVIDPALAHFLQVQQPLINRPSVHCDDLTSSYWVSFTPTVMFGVRRAINLSLVHQ